eukprot:g4298.t1
MPLVGSTYIRAIRGTSTSNGEMYFLRKSTTQITILAFIFFCLPGMFNAVSSMAGGIDPNKFSIANTIAFATFTCGSFLAPIFYILFGARILLLIGSLGYLLFVVALLLVSEIPNDITWFLYLSGAIAGLLISLLWQAQSAMILSYPTLDSKGNAIAIFWTIYNFGGVFGGLIVLCTNLDETAQGKNTYLGMFIAFLIVMFLGAALIFTLIVKPSNVIRPDDSLVDMPDEKIGSQIFESIGIELYEVLKVFCDKHMLAMAPVILYTNWVQAFEFSIYNAQLFNRRTMGLNTMLYWTASMVFSMCTGKFLDLKIWTPFKRGLSALLLWTIIAIPTWTVSTFIVYPYMNAPFPAVPIDFEDSDTGQYIGYSAVYFFFGAADAIIQVIAFWTMGQLTDNPITLSRYAGFFKGVQNLGSMIGWLLNGLGVNSVYQLFIDLGLLFLAICSITATLCAFLPGAHEVQYPSNFIQGLSADSIKCITFLPRNSSLRIISLRQQASQAMSKRYSREIHVQKLDLGSADIVSLRKPSKE